MSPQTCANCFHTIISDKHKQECCSIYMSSQRTLNYKDENTFKPMMTFGLNGCYAYFIVNKTTHTITMGHYPPVMRSNVITELQRYMNNENCVIYIKAPEVYVKDESTGKWHTDTSFDMFKFLDFASCEVIKELYSTGMKSINICNNVLDFSYMSSIYVDYDDVEGVIDYTNRYGKWVSISIR